MDSEAVFFENFQNALCDIGVFTGEKLLSSLYDGDFGAKAAEELCKFKAYITASDNKQMPRELTKLLNGGRVKNMCCIHCLYPWDLGSRRPLSRIDKDQISADRSL